MPIVNLQILGVDRLRRQFRALDIAVARGAQQGIQEAGNLLLEKSLEVAPKDTGNMEDGSFVRRRGSGYRTVISVGYQAPYAAMVHEDIGKAHGTSYNVKYAQRIANKERYLAVRQRPDGSIAAYNMVYHNRRSQEQAKFLERPFYENLDRMVLSVRQGVVRAIHYVTR